MSSASIDHLNLLAASCHAPLVKELVLHEPRYLVPDISVSTIHGVNEAKFKEVEGRIVPIMEKDVVSHAADKGSPKTVLDAAKRFNRLEILRIWKPLEPQVIHSDHPSPTHPGMPIRSSVTSQHIYLFRKLVEQVKLEHVRTLVLAVVNVADFDFLMRDLQIQVSGNDTDKKTPTWRVPQALRAFFDQLSHLSLLGSPLQLRSAETALLSSRERKDTGYAMYIVASLARNVEVLNVVTDGPRQLKVPPAVHLAAGGKLRDLYMPMAAVTLKGLTKLFETNLGSIETIGTLGESTTTKILINPPILNILSRSETLLTVPKHFLDTLLCMWILLFNEAHDLQEHMELLNSGAKLLTQINSNRRRKVLPEFDAENVVSPEQPKNMNTQTEAVNLMEI